MLYENYKMISQEIGDAQLLVVSKQRSIESISELYDHGVRLFGENRIEELREKKLALPEDITWHFIGRIQSKKIRHIVQCANLIHSVDSFKTLDLINKEASKINKVQDVLIQLNVSDEESKTGFNESELDKIMDYVSDLENVNVVGLMTMAPFTDDEDVLRKVFSAMQQNYLKYYFTVLSMGMSNDYMIALEYGANLVRVGTKIFE